MEFDLPGTYLGPIEKIAVLRANALGDYVMTLPALTALKKAYPEAELVLLGTPMHAELLANRPGPVDRVEVVPEIVGLWAPSGREDAAETERFFERMRNEEFDLAVQLHGGGKFSNPFVNSLGAKTTIGLQAFDADPVERSIPYVYYHHEILRFLEVVGLVGADPVGLSPELIVTDQDRERVDDILGDDVRPLVVLHPGASDSRRHWPASRFAQVADALAAEGARVLVTGTKSERDLAQRIVDLATCGVESLAGSLDLSALVGLLERAVLVVSNDTGPRHLAEAVGTATVSIYWCGNLINAGPLARARHRAHVSWQIDCPVCGANGMSDLYPARTGGTMCTHRDSFVAQVPVAEVLPDALELFRAETSAA
jgi:ADP-heptose:LPS heptosyltransferase